MPTLPSGEFSFTIPPTDLSRGLRTSRRNPRNVKYLTKCEGAVGLDSILQVLSNLNLSRIDTALITDPFPYPQMFVFTNTIVVCGETEIYELVAGSLVSVLAGLAVGIIWSAIDLYDFIYMSNGAVAVIRRAEDKVWQVTTAQPIAGAICNFNGQIFIGAPGVDQS